MHSSVQRLQQVLVNLDHTPDGIDDEQCTVDRYVLLAARIDTRLADLCNYLHAFLERQSLGMPDELGWSRLLVESDMRIRKCLKLFACVSSALRRLLKPDELV